MTFLFLQPFCKGSILTTQEEKTLYIKGACCFFYFFFAAYIGMSTSKESKCKGMKGFGEENSNYIHRSLWFRINVYCFRFSVQSKGRRLCSSAWWHWGFPVFRSALNWMIDNDSHQTEPEANYRGWGSVLHICCLCAFTIRVKLFQRLQYLFLIQTECMVQEWQERYMQKNTFTDSKAGYQPMISESLY